VIQVIQTRNPPRAILLISGLFFALSLGACGQSDSQLRQEATALQDHYTRFPPDRGWKVQNVTADIKTGELVVNVLVIPQADIDYIKTLSRMDQFAAAKRACPKMTPKLRAAIRGKSRIWVYLKINKKKTLTASICPQT